MILTNNKFRLRVAVVPEHFSIPFTIAQDKGIFKKYDLDVQIKEFPRGTGSMCKALADSEIEVAVALTEGLVSDKINHNTNYSIAASYVTSPLNWGIVANEKSSLSSVEELKGKTFGISRFGSGSHIMAYLLAKEHKWDLDQLKFSVKGGLEDLLKGIEDFSTDSFLWEKFMLKHYVLDKKLKYIGNIVTPWSCFCIAIRNDILTSYNKELKTFLLAIQEACLHFKVERLESLEMIQKKCKLDKDDSSSWFSTVEFSKDGSLSKKMLLNTMDILEQCGVVKKSVNVDDLIDKDFTKLVD